MTLQEILPYLSKQAIQQIVSDLLVELEKTKKDLEVLHKQLISSKSIKSFPSNPKVYPYENKKSYWLKWQKEQDKLSKPNIYVHDVSLEESIAAEWDKLKNDTPIKTSDIDTSTWTCNGKIDSSITEESIYDESVNNSLRNTFTIGNIVRYRGIQSSIYPLKYKILNIDSEKCTADLECINDKDQKGKTEVPLIFLEFIRNAKTNQQNKK